MTVSGEVTGGQHPGKNEIEVNGIQPGYFDVTGLKILRGRDFNRADFAFGSPVAIVSREMARAFWGTEEVLGKRIRVNDDVAPVSIVGVVSELPSTVAANDESHGLLYLPMRPRADQGVILQARIGEVDPRVLGAQIVAQLRRFPRRVAPTEAMTLDEYYDRQLLPQRLLASGSAGLAALQFLLAMAGVSGLVAHMTTRRRREIGIRTALGAGRGDVLALVMRQGARLTAIGGTLGLLVGIAAGQIVAMAMPVSIPALVGALATAAVAVILVGGGAMLLPAWKALRVGPATALRYD
jgi:ABC-type antimicrobial peptide transport system permease subunit